MGPKRLVNKSFSQGRSVVNPVAVAKPEGSLSLVKAVGSSLWKPLLSPVIPRLFLTAFRSSQPILISQAITFVKNDQEGTGDRCGAFTIFCAALIVYFGLAVSLFRFVLKKYPLLM